MNVVALPYGSAVSTSLPAPPSRVSLLPEPLNVSLPPCPCNTSTKAFTPLSVSADSLPNTSSARVLIWALVQTVPSANLICSSWYNPEPCANQFFTVTWSLPLASLNTRSTPERSGVTSPAPIPAPKLSTSVCT